MWKGLEWKHSVVNAGGDLSGRVDQRAFAYIDNQLCC